MASFKESPVKPVPDIESRKAAVRTLRKLPVFGYNNGGQYVPDYEWPTADDILEMPRDKPIKIATFTWKRCDQINTVIGGLQINLTNGKSSPQFLTKVQNSLNFVSTE